MASLGSKARPAVVKVQTEERAQEILALCDENDWQVIVGMEPDEPEDITDVLKLQNPELFIARRPELPGRNDPCTCGSGVKFKKCCLVRQSAPSS
jgi:SWIM/SEC-C metal-binding protein